MLSPLGLAGLLLLSYLTNLGLDTRVVPRTNKWGSTLFWLVLVTWVLPSETPTPSDNACGQSTCFTPSVAQVPLESHAEHIVKGTHTLRLEFLFISPHLSCSATQ